MSYPEVSSKKNMILLSTGRDPIAAASSTANVGSSSNSSSIAPIIAIDDSLETISTSLSFKSNNVLTFTTSLSCSVNTFSGLSVDNPGEYLLVSCQGKPAIQVLSWQGKTSIQTAQNSTSNVTNLPSAVGLTLPLQESFITMCVNSTGQFLLGGTRKGNLYVYNLASGELIKVILGAHFQAITVLKSSLGGDNIGKSSYVISASDDSSVKLWDWVDLVDKNSNNKQVKPFCTWTPHVLPVTDAIFLQDAASSSLRVATVSLDHQLVIYDVLNAAIISRLTFPQPLRIISSSYLSNFFYIGSTKGQIYIVPLDVSSYTLLNTNTNSSSLSNAAAAASASAASDSTSSSSTSASSIEGMKFIDAHLDSITGIISHTANTFISVSLDGKIKLWDSFTRQCLKVLTPFQGQPINHCKYILYPEVLNPSIAKPYPVPIPPLRKYIDPSSSTSNSIIKKVVLGPILLGDSRGSYEPKRSYSATSSVATGDLKKKKKEEKVQEESEEENEEELEIVEDNQAEELEDEEEEEFISLPSEPLQAPESEDDNQEEEENQEEEDA